MKRFYATLKDANKARDELKRRRSTDLTKNNNVAVYDLKKAFPRRRKTRFFVGDYFEWLNL